MNHTRMIQLATNTFETLLALLKVKGGEYSSDADALANFKRGAGLTGTTPLQTMLVYMSKHYDAVATYVRDDAAGVTRERSEPIDGRLDDLMNYCLLMKALVEEQNEERHNANVSATLGKSNRRDRSKRAKPAIDLAELADRIQGRRRPAGS